VTLPSDQVTEPVTVQPYDGDSGNGPDFLPPVSTFCFLDASRKLVTNASGDEVVSETTLLLDPETDPALDLPALFVPESKVTIRGRDSRVITAHPVIDRGDLAYLDVATT